MKISELIVCLARALQEIGDVPVQVDQDAEWSIDRVISVDSGSALIVLE